jgi:hypothetical protein
MRTHTHTHTNTHSHAHTHTFTQDKLSEGKQLEAKEREVAMESVEQAQVFRELNQVIQDFRDILRVSRVILGYPGDSDVFGIFEIFRLLGWLFRG